MDENEEKIIESDRVDSNLSSIQSNKDFDDNLKFFQTSRSKTMPPSTYISVQKKNKEIIIWINFNLKY